MIRGSEPNSSASARAAVGPTCRIDSATRTFHSGRVLDGVQVRHSFWPLADSAPALVRNSSDLEQPLLVEVEQVALVVQHARRRSAPPRPRSPAPRCPAPSGPRCRSAAPCAARGSPYALGQRMSASPSFSYASVVPQDGHVVGIVELALGAVAARPPPGPSTSGITSPALRITTRSPISTPLRLTSLALCSVAIATVEPGDLHRLHHRERRDPAGAAHVDLDVQQRRGRLLRRVLVGDRPARRARRGAEPALLGDLVDLDHDAVDLVLDVVAVRAPVLDVREQLVAVVDHLGVRRHRQAPRRRAPRTPRTAAPARSPRACRGRGRSAAACGSR